MAFSEIPLRCLDLFSGAGGAAKGYQIAGFHVTGVDIAPQPRYVGDDFHQTDALEFLAEHGHEFDAIHASPPCQRFSAATPAGCRGRHPDLVEPLRTLLRETGKPYVIENVMAAPLEGALILCGTMFGLPLFRHRLFEISHLILSPPACNHRGKRIGTGGFCTVAGGGNSGVRDRAGGRMIRRRPEDGVNGWRASMGIDWMTRDELAQAIPPAYTEFIGRQLREALR